MATFMSSGEFLHHSERGNMEVINQSLAINTGEKLSEEVNRAIANVQAQMGTSG
jgi:hypothetical protein